MGISTALPSSDKPAGRRLEALLRVPRLPVVLGGAAGRRRGLVCAALFFCVVIPVALLFAMRDADAAPKQWCRIRKSGITACGVYVVDLKTGRVLLEKNPEAAFYPASTVKLLTALVVLDHLSPDGRVVVTKRAAAARPTKAGLLRGRSYSVRDLLRVLLATSANDAGIALAEAVAGSEQEFSYLMNKKARGLGAKSSRFTNATGLPDPRQVTTARDLLIITREAFKNPFIASAMQERAVAITAENGRKIVRYNHNKLLWRLAQPRVLGKTGYTRSALHCYAGVAYGEKKNLALVILKSRNPWSDIYRILGVDGKKKGRG